MKSTEEPRIFTYGEFDVSALYRLASNLRHNSPCSCDMNQVPASGSFSWAVFIKFEDGIEWVMHSPRTGYGNIPVEWSAKLLESEASTLIYIRENSDIPVPDVYSYSPTNNNDIGIPYILMSRAPGKALQETWNSLETSQTTTSTQMERKILSQLGAITQKLSHLRFNQIGSLFLHNGNFHIGECLSRGHILHDRCSIEDIPRGPFPSSSAYFESLIHAFILHAEILPLWHHCFTAPVPCRSSYPSREMYVRACDLWNDFVTVEGKIDSAANRLDYILSGEALRDMLPTWLQSLSIAPLDGDDGGTANSFPLHHPDLTVNNIYVDEEYNITCIIDWMFCSSVPEVVLLMAPGLPQSRDKLPDDLVSSFEDGFKAAASDASATTAATAATTSAVSTHVSLGKTEREMENKVTLLQQGKCAWSLTRLLTFDSIDDYGLFVSVWEHVRGARGEGRASVASYLATRRSLSRNIGRYLEMQMEDEPADKIQKQESDYFKHGGRTESVARYLTVISQWGSLYCPVIHRQEGFRRNRAFIADSRFWTWILRFIEDREDTF